MAPRKAKAKGKGHKGKGKPKGSKTPQDGVVAARSHATSEKSVLPSQAKRLGGSGKGHPHANYHSAVCSQVDPFCSSALGARIPDGNAGRSIAYQMRGSFTVGIGASGLGGALVIPYYPYIYQTVAPATGTSLTWSSTYVAPAAATAFSSAVGMWRIVSWGVKVGSILNATNNNGFAVVASASSLNSTTGTVPDMEFDDARMFSLNTFKGTTWLSKRLSNYGLYNALNNATNGFPAVYDNYTAFVLQLQGTAATAAVLCEVVMNLEFTPLQDSASALLAAKGPVKNDAVLTGASHVQAKVPATFMKDVDEVGSAIEGIVKSSPLGMIAQVGSDLLKAL
jgi:hypothetical protein